MSDYFVCFIFWGVFVLFLYAFGNVLIAGEEIQSVKLMAGYLAYSFLVAIGGIIVQVANMKWNVFAVYMVIVLAGICVLILVMRLKRGSFFSCSLKEYIEKNWFLYLVCLILICMLFCYFRPFWYGNHLDDGYYLTKVATLPYETNAFRTNYSVGVEKLQIDSYIFNTWELEASFYVKFLHVNVVLFLRLFQAAYHYFIFLNCVLAFGYKLIVQSNREIAKERIQYVVGLILVFFIYYVYLMDTGLFFVRDMFHVDAAMYYGASLIKMTVVLLLLLFYIEKDKIDLKMIAGVGMISVVMISKTGIVLPVIFITALACSMVWLFENPDLKMKGMSVLLGILCIMAGFIIPAGIDEQKEVYKFVLTTVRSPVVLFSVVIFAFSFTLKSRVVYRMNQIFIICGVMMLVPQINDLFEFVSFYSFVAARAWSTYVYTFVIVSFFYLYLLLRRYLSYRIVKRIYLSFTVILTIMMVHGYNMDGGELFVTDDLPAKTHILEDAKKIYHNHYFIPNSTIELGNALEELAKETEDQLVVVSPQWADIDGTLHTLATQLRIFAPSVISISASERYPVEQDSEWYGFEQRKYDEFLNNPTKNTMKRFEQETEKYGINCIVVPNGQCAKELESMGYECRYSVQEGVYYIWYRAKK